jgi:hypothetical protein
MENRETIEKRILMKIQPENVQSRNKNDVGAHRKTLANEEPKQQ